MTKLLVVGLDGATWDLLDLLIKSGKLPNIQRLRDYGVYGTLDSTTPPVTAPAWASFATGKAPGEHGCFDFVKLKNLLNDVRVITRLDVRGRTFYEVLDERGFKCILMNLPLSWPHMTKNGILTASITTRSDEKFFPKELLHQIPELENYRVVPDTSLVERDELADFVGDVRKLEEEHFECAKSLFRMDWDFFFILFSGTDFIQHLLYDKLFRLEEDFGAIELYRDIDHYIGWFIENSPLETNTFIMSDHGFTTYTGTFFVNEWLRREGFLQIRPRKESRIAEHKFVEEMARVRMGKWRLKAGPFILRHLGKFGFVVPLYELVRKIVPLDVSLNFEPIPDETVAYCVSSESWGIYINAKGRFDDGIVDAEDYEKVRGDIIQKLRSLRGPRSGKPLFKEVLEKERVYCGDTLGEAFDIVLIPNEYSISSGLYPTLFENNAKNNHALHGIFIAYGKDIKSNMELSDVKIWDIAPTLLHIFGLSIPRDIDGKVLKDIFREESEPARRDILYETGYRDEVRSRIRMLKSRNRI